MFFLEDKLINPHWGWGGTGNPHLWCFSCVLGLGQCFLRWFYPIYPIFPQPRELMSVSPPYTEGSRGWGLGRSWRVGFKFQPILLRRASSFLTVVLLLSLLKIKTKLIRINLGAWLWILRLLQPSRVYLEGSGKFSWRFGGKCNQWRHMASLFKWRNIE